MCPSQAWAEDCCISWSRQEAYESSLPLFFVLFRSSMDWMKHTCIQSTSLSHQLQR